MQLFSLIATLFVHLVLKKILQNINPIFKRYENSSSKIIVLCFVVDFGLIESIFHKRITKIIYSINAMKRCTPDIPWLNNTSEQSLSNILGRIIGNFVLQILICILIYYLNILLLLVLLLVFFKHTLFKHTFICFIKQISTFVAIK